MSTRSCPDFGRLVGVRRLRHRALKVAEDARKKAEDARKKVEDARKKAEDARKEPEDVLTEDENVLTEDEEPSLKLRAVSLAPPALTVTTNSVGLEMGSDLLVGQYLERGINHGRKFYQKIVYGHDPSVIFHFWDQRDGAEWAGWWFSDQLGGGNCWARCSNYVDLVGWTTPPRSGWKIAWDADRFEGPGLLFVEKGHGSCVKPRNIARQFN